MHLYALVAVGALLGLSLWHSRHPPSLFQRRHTVTRPVRVTAGGPRLLILGHSCAGTPCGPAGNPVTHRPPDTLETTMRRMIAIGLVLAVAGVAGAGAQATGTTAFDAPDRAF